VGTPHNPISGPFQGPNTTNTSLITVLFEAPTRVAKLAGHAYRISHLTNGTVGWPAEIRIKEGAPGWVSPPEDPVAGALAAHRGLRPESRGQPSAEVGDPTAQRGEERSVECNTLIPQSRRPIALEDDQTGDESSYSVSPPCHPWEYCYLRL
jgi:hypothetical protein